MIGQSIRRAREQRGKKLIETATAAGVRAEHLSRFERGQREMSTAALSRVLAVLDLVVAPREHVVPPSADAAA